jgi:hypothetical protein
MDIKKLFSDDIDHSTYYHRYNFGSIDAIPGCEIFRFDPSKPLKFKKQPGCSNYEIIELPLLAALDLLGDDKFEMHPPRWYRVKKQISEKGEIEYPWICSSATGSVSLMDGRHRIIAMIKFLGMTHAPFIVEPDHRIFVEQYFYQNSTESSNI